MSLIINILFLLSNEKPYSPDVREWLNGGAQQRLYLGVTLEGLAHCANVGLDVLGGL